MLRGTAGRCRAVGVGGAEGVAGQLRKAPGKSGRARLAEIHAEVNKRQGYIQSLKAQLCINA